MKKNNSQCSVSLGDSIPKIFIQMVCCVLKKHLERNSVFRQNVRFHQSTDDMEVWR